MWSTMCGMRCCGGKRGGKWRLWRTRRSIFLLIGVRRLLLLCEGGESFSSSLDMGGGGVKSGRKKYEMSDFGFYIFDFGCKGFF